MSTNPRLALDRLIGALETFHQAAVSAQDPDAPSVVEAADMLADAYTVYDDVMFVQFGVEAPLDVYGDMEDDDYDGALDDDEFEDFDLDERMRTTSTRTRIWMRETKTTSRTWTRRSTRTQTPISTSMTRTRTRRATKERKATTPTRTTPMQTASPTEARKATAQTRRTAPATSEAS